jgi:hypothetical protein
MISMTSPYGVGTNPVSLPHPILFGFYHLVDLARQRAR